MPQPRCRLSRAESRSIHSSHSSPHPRKWRSTFEPSIWMTRAGYHRFCTSSASTSESTVSDLRQSSGGSLSRSRFRDDDDASGGSLSRSAGRFRDIDMPSRRRMSRRRTLRVPRLQPRWSAGEGDQRTLKVRWDDPARRAGHVRCFRCTLCRKSPIHQPRLECSPHAIECVRRPIGEYNPPITPYWRNVVLPV